MTEKRRAIELALREAIEQDQFRLAYQPVVGIGDGQIVGFEALLSWEHPELGPIAPNDFIPIAEEARLLGRIGEWVIRHACAEAAQWPRGLRLLVNISAEQLLDPRLPAILVSALAQSKLAPARFEAEISEQAMERGDEATLAALERLRAIGVRLTLDNFGSGQGALGHFRRGRFSTIKIDRASIRAASENSSDSVALIRAVVALADVLGVMITAEGVETAREAAVARELGCGQIQGIAAGAPIMPGAVRELLTQRQRWVA